MNIHKKCMEEMEQLRERAEKAEAKCTKMREALKKHGRHEYVCELVPCTCGFKQAIEETKCE